jgi:predicted ATPase/DNA-binding SARP family transcriptional activator
VRVRLLGPLRLAVDGRDVDVPGPRRRAVLALLALAPGVVPDASLVDALWPDEPPESGRRALHSHISRLRRHLGPAGHRLVREGTGYRLDLAPPELDVAAVRAAAADAAGRGGHDALAAALAAWDGEALDEFADVAPLASEAVALAELRRDLTDRWLALRLDGAADRTAAADLVADATRAAAAEPDRERTQALLVRALARAGRQAEALRHAHGYRRRLAEATGLDPGPDLVAAEREAAEPLAAEPTPGTTGAAPRRLARPAAPLVGREHELRALARRVEDERLVTVVGPGGVGKTRLAFEVAADAGAAGRDVRVVELAEVEDAPRVPGMLASALGLQVTGDDRILDAAADALAVGHPVLVLDNCEHVIESARAVAGRLADSCPGLTVLATSRQPLGLAAEHVVRLGPLPVPDGSAGGGAMASAPAVRAFLAHAHRRLPDWEPEADEAPLVAELVRRLDGLPLALELAAGRVGTLSLADLTARLDRALDLFEAGTTGSDARHRTLRHTIDWSYQALADDDQRLLAAMAVFPGGVDLDTAEQLAAGLGVRGDPAALVARLVDTSMLAAPGAPSGPAGRRFRALETVRTFMLERLADDGRRDAADAALVAWACDLTAEVAQLRTGPREPEADVRVRAETANLQAAWDVAARRGDVDARVAIVAALDRFTTWRDVPEISGWALELVADGGVDDHPRRAEMWGAAAHSAWRRGNLDEAERLARAALDAAARPEDTAAAREALATVHLFRGDGAAARDLFLSAVDFDVEDGPTLFASAALCSIYAGDRVGARSLLDRAFAGTESRALSHQAFAHYTAGELEAADDPEAAMASYRRAIVLAHRAGATFVAGVASVGLVRLWTATGRTADALAGYRTLLDHWRRAGHWTQMWTTLRNLVGPLADSGQAETAALLLAAADAAPEAARVTVPAVAAELAALDARLTAELGPERAEAARTRGAALPRGRVVDAAVAAIDAALA